LAGFAPAEVMITAEQYLLIVEGRKSEEAISSQQDSGFSIVLDLKTTGAVNSHL
jgi:HSP20 family molecular chaperone IbpA